MIDKQNLEKRVESLLEKIPKPSDPSHHDTANKDPPRTKTPPVPPQKLVERCTILHDSLGKRVNDTLLSREGVGVSKVWALIFKQ